MSRPIPDRATTRSSNTRWSGGVGIARNDSSFLAIACAGIVSVASVPLVVAAARGAIPWASGFALALVMPAACVDIRERRLPDTWIASAAIALVIGLSLTLLVDDGAEIDARSALVGACVMAAPLLVVHLVSPRSIGFGDVKLTALLGAALGLVDWRLAVMALCIAALGAAVSGVATRRRTVAFGPFLVVATWAVLIANRPILDHWLNGGNA